HSEPHPANTERDARPTSASSSPCRRTSRSNPVTCGQQTPQRPRVQAANPSNQDSNAEPAFVGALLGPASTPLLPTEQAQTGRSHFVPKRRLSPLAVRAS